MDDFDVFGYWDDLEYGDDSYWEYEPNQFQSGSKRKRAALNASKPKNKRVKMSLSETQGDNVIFVDRGTRTTLAIDRRLTNQKYPSFALLPDWRQRYADTSGEILTKEMPAAMRKAAEAQDDEQPHEDHLDGEDVDDWETDDEDEIEDLKNQLGSADPELVRSIMQSKLNEIGLQDMNAETLLGDLETMDEDTYLATLEKLAAATQAKQGKTSSEKTNDGRGHASVDDHGPDGEDDIGDLQDTLASLDPEILKTVLKQKLGGTGMSDADENSLMTMLGKMVNGEDEADEMADEFMKSMLDRAAQGNDPALSGWLAQQGVSLDDADEDEEDNEPVATAEASGAENLLSQSQAVEKSPSDSVVGTQIAVNGTSRPLALHGSSPTASTKKRTAPSTPANDQGAGKRKKVSFDAPPSSGSTAQSQHDSVIQVEEDNAAGSTTTNKDDNDTIQVLQAKQSTRSNVEDDRGDNIRVIQQGIPDGLSAKANGSNDLEDESQIRTVSTGEAEVVAVAPAPAKNTRKRKAETEKLAPNKKQAKKVSGPAANAGKRTRTTRSTVKAGK